MPADVGGSAYQLGLISGELLPDDPAIAILSANARAVAKDGKTIVENVWNGIFAPVRFTVCTSAEGLHFNAWAHYVKGEQRVWHLYFHLQYEVEPTCTESET